MLHCTLEYLAKLSITSVLSLPTTAAHAANATHDECHGCSVNGWTLTNWSPFNWSAEFLSNFKNLDTCLWIKEQQPAHSLWYVLTLLAVVMDGQQHKMP